LRFEIALLFSNLHILLGKPLRKVKTEQGINSVVSGNSIAYGIPEQAIYLDLSYGRKSVLLSVLGPAQGHVLDQLFKTKVRWLAPFQNRSDDIRREERHVRHRGYLFSTWGDSSCRFVILPIPLGTHNGEIAIRTLKRICPESEIDRRHSNTGFQLRRSLESHESVLPHWVFILDRFIARLKNQLEIQKRRSGFRVHRGPARLVDNGHIRHLERRGFAICAERQAIRWNRRDPIQAFRRDRRMEIVNLVCGDRRSPENSQSCVSEDRLVCLARGPVFARHVTVIGGWSAPSETVPFVVCAHAMESTAPSQPPLEVIDARKFDIGRSWLVVIAILIEPRNWIWAGSTIRW